MNTGGWRTESDELRAVNPWWSYRIATYSMPSGVAGTYHYVHTPGSVMVIPLTEDGRLLLVRQHRYLNRRDSIEFPGGGNPEGMPAAEAARLELAQEGGVEPAQLEEIGTFNPYNGVTDELCRVFIARGLSPSTVQPDATEDCAPLLLLREEFEASIRAGDVWDGMTLAAWQLFCAHEGY